MTDERPATYFSSPDDWRGWLEQHHDSETELWVGFWKGHTRRPTLTWPQSVDHALCFGWIDGLRQKVDEDRYRIRFTPRKTSSIWSAVNLRRFVELQDQGRVHARGIAAYGSRKEGRQVIYAYEVAERELPQEYAGRLEADPAALTFWQPTRPSYRRVATNWVLSAKREATRDRRMNELVEDCRAGRLIRSQRY